MSAVLRRLIPCIELYCRHHAQLYSAWPAGVLCSMPPDWDSVARPKRRLALRRWGGAGRPFSGKWAKFVRLTPGCRPRESGDPVRRALSIPSLPPLEYRVARSSRATTPVGVAANTASHSRRLFRARFGLLVPPSHIRGRRECRAPDAPDSRVCRGSGWTHTRCQVTPESPGIPRAMVYGLLRALPGDRAFLPPSPARIASRELDASVGASGPHDFAVRIRRRRLRHHPRPPHPAPRFVTLRNAPEWGGTAGDIKVIWSRGQEKILKIGNELKKAVGAIRPSATDAACVRSLVASCQPLDASLRRPIQGMVI